jgi:hypothetical protein
MRTLSSTRLFTVVVPVVCGLAILLVPTYMPSGKRVGMHHGSHSNKPDPDYQHAISLALQSGSEQLQTWFTLSDGIKLQERMPHLTHLAFSNPWIAAVDIGEPGVYLFRPDGRLEHRLGRPGLDPGEYVGPVAASFGPDFVAVADFTKKRVSQFSPEGGVTGSFVYGPQGFSAQAIAYDRRSDQFFLFGNRWPQYSGSSSTLFVHRYSATGQFQGSAFSIPARAEALNLTSDDHPFIEVEGDGDPVRFMLPWQNILYSVSAVGQVSVVFDGGIDEAFHAPSSPMPTEDGLAGFQRWTRSWTPVVAFATDGDTLLIETECLCPAHYRLAIWSLSEHKLLTSLFTNRKLVSQQNHSFVFLQEPENPEESEYELIKARLH